METTCKRGRGGERRPRGAQPARGEAAPGVAVRRELRPVLLRWCGACDGWISPYGAEYADFLAGEGAHRCRCRRSAISSEVRRTLRCGSGRAVRAAVKAGTRPSASRPQPRAARRNFNACFTLICRRRPKTSSRVLRRRPNLHQRRLLRARLCVHARTPTAPKPARRLAARRVHGVLRRHARRRRHGAAPQLRRRRRRDRRRRQRHRRRPSGAPRRRPAPRVPNKRARRRRPRLRGRRAVPQRWNPTRRDARARGNLLRQAGWREEADELRAWAVIDGARAVSMLPTCAAVATRNNVDALGLRRAAAASIPIPSSPASPARRATRRCWTTIGIGRSSPSTSASSTTRRRASGCSRAPAPRSSSSTTLRSSPRAPTAPAASPPRSPTFGAAELRGGGAAAALEAGRRRGDRARLAPRVRRRRLRRLARVRRQAARRPRATAARAARGLAPRGVAGAAVGGAACAPARRRRGGVAGGRVTADGIQNVWCGSL